VYYVFGEVDGGKAIYLNCGFCQRPFENDLIAIVQEPTGFFNPATDIAFV
jgi:hypothetical protein